MCTYDFLGDVTNGPKAQRVSKPELEVSIRGREYPLLQLSDMHALAEVFLGAVVGSDRSCVVRGEGAGGGRRLGPLDLRLLLFGRLGLGLERGILYSGGSHVDLLHELGRWPSQCKKAGSEGFAGKQGERKM